MRNISYDNITETVVRAYSGGKDARTREIVTLLIQRLHDFVREVELTPKEWEAAIGFLTRAASITDEKPNEFILLSDLFGVSGLVDLADVESGGIDREAVGSVVIVSNFNASFAFESFPMALLLFEVDDKHLTDYVVIQRNTVVRVDEFC